MANDAEQARSPEGHQPGPDNQAGAPARRAFVATTVMPRAYVELCRENADAAILDVRLEGYGPVSILEIRSVDHTCVKGDRHDCMPIAHMRDTRGYRQIHNKMARALAAGFWPVHL
jgi:hypothetical protein